MEVDQFKWGVIGSMDKANAFAADFPFAEAEHILYAVLTDGEDSEPDQVPRIYNDLQHFLESDIDAVYIACPYQQHYSYAKQCLLFHKPVLCEKPIATDIEELEHLIRLSQNNRVFMMEAMWIRFLPSVKKVLSIVSNGTIGDIVSIKSSISYKNKNESTSTATSQKGGALYELGSYPVFLCVLFLGQPDYITSAGSRTSSNANEFFSAFLSYEEGQYAFIEASTVNRGNSYAVIEGDEGVIQIKNPWSVKPEGIEVDLFDGSKVLHKAEWEGRGFQFEADEVYKCWKAGEIESQLYPHQFSLDVMKTLDSIRKKTK